MVKPWDDNNLQRSGRRACRATRFAVGMTEEQRRGGSFFGRRKGKPLRPAQRKAVETVLPTLLIDLEKKPPSPLTALFPVPVGAVRLEIGFGGGEHLLHAARTLPDVGFIGVEPFEAGLAKTVIAIARAAIANVRLYDQDAALVLDWLPEDSMARIDLLFPDPWPKKRHWKRRFVSQANLDRIARCLAAGGTFRFATDVEDYAAWTREEVSKHGGLSLVEDRDEPWANWPGTRYEAKAAKAGRGAVFLEYENA